MEYLKDTVASEIRDGLNLASRNNRRTKRNETKWLPRRHPLSPILEARVHPRGGGHISSHTLHKIRRLIVAHRLLGVTSTYL